MQICAVSAAALGIRVIALLDAWARRRFIVCFRDQAALQPAARRMVELLTTAAAIAPGRQALIESSTGAPAG